MRAWLAPLQRQGKRIGFVPTMGALHAGHLSLVEYAQRHTDVVMASVFVNPTQFAAHEDFGSYPRRLEQDAQMLAQAGVQAVFAPPAGEIYPPNAELRISLPSLGQQGEGVPRPHFFDGVALVVTKLLNIVQPQAAFFGKKDYQQWFLLRKLAQELCLPVEIIGCPIVREPDGLAMSSRNEYLSPQERELAPKIFELLEFVAQNHRQFADATGARAFLEDQFSRIPEFRLDYYEVRDATTFELTEGLRAPFHPLQLVAVWLGKTRLIDNLPIFPEDL
jgi:pantoate--beta-alanine ligase